MVDQLMAPQEFLLSERYAAAVKTLGLALFFMPVLPISIIIAFCGESLLLQAPVHVTAVSTYSCLHCPAAVSPGVLPCDLSLWVRPGCPSPMVLA